MEVGVLIFAARFFCRHSLVFWRILTISAIGGIFPGMATLNISLSDEQKSWLTTRQETAGFASASDVVRDLIRERQEHEEEELRRQFMEMDRRDGSDEPEAEADIVAAVRKIRKELRAKKPGRS